ncbi:phosphopentomutase [Breznakia pachnodae]|uniref:Phosphopentomutase n=1 Tax=Breznakia pachnodae TaxID=265178 RepID=A0ABU0E5R9_9FIRM|nr:phosphopentomutase [Breznakia pachnodae]MDQ0362091.1 phosphopentomutase [Breznakia pachnodae]
MSNRFIVVVLDSFGVGEMKDVAEVRPQDVGANTALHLLESSELKSWNTLIDLGLMNAIDTELPVFKKSSTAICGIANLKHYGADSFFGHQEIMGTNPKKPLFSKLSEVIDDIEITLRNEGYQTKRIYKDGKEILSVNDCMFVGDNIETDLGQAFNVIGAIDLCGFDEIKNVGKIVRGQVKVARVIAFGGSGVSYQNLVDNIKVFDEYIGVDAPGSGVYKANYHVVHLGYGVDEKVQLPYQLHKKGVDCYFYGKVADIVINPSHHNYSCVDSSECFEKLLDDIRKKKDGFYCLNIQETDLAGHAQDVKRYVDRINLCDQYLNKIISELDTNDILLVCADHGNDPTIGHAKHTREKVPLLIYTPNLKDVSLTIGERDTLADIGATVAEYFDCQIQYGTSFLPLLKKKENHYE